MRLERFAGKLRLMDVSGIQRCYSGEEEKLLKEYFSRPKPLRPEERSRRIIRSFVGSYKGFDDVPSHIWERLIDDITGLIKYTAHCGVDWEE